MWRKVWNISVFFVAMNCVILKMKTKIELIVLVKMLLGKLFKN